MTHNPHVKTRVEGDDIFVEITFGKLDRYILIDDIPYSPQGSYSKGMFSFKDDDEQFGDERTPVEDEEGYVNGAGVTGYRAVYCDCPVSTRLDLNPFIAHHEGCKNYGIIV